MEFRILGPLEVADGDALVALAGAKQRALLAILLLRANEVVSADRLIDDLWGEQSPESGRTALQVLHLPAAKGARPRRRGACHAPAGVHPAARARAARPVPLRAPGRGGDAAEPAVAAGKLREALGAVARAAARRPRATSRLRSRRSGGWRSFASRRWRSGSRPIWRSVATPTWSPSWRRSPPSTRCASACAPS